MDINEIEKFKANISVKEAKHLQTKLSAKVIQKNGFKKPSVISGIDLSVIKEQKKLISGIVSFSYPGMEIIERVSRVVDETFPYIPGLLSFRA